jgi:conjugative transfer region lipoprotein (TIGR03751 family)
MAWTDAQRIHRATFAAASLMGAFALAGCTALAPRTSPLPSDGPTMAEIYRRHMASEGPGSPRERLPLRAADEDVTALQRTRLSESLNNRFERLPNPDLTMHVFPHLAQGRYPVPGYDTVFPMYESVHYALPGEVAPRQHRVHVAPAAAHAVHEPMRADATASRRDPPTRAGAAPVTR